MGGIAGLMTAGGQAPMTPVLDRLGQEISHRGRGGWWRHVLGAVGLVGAEPAMDGAVGGAVGGIVVSADAVIDDAANAPASSADRLVIVEAYQRLGPEYARHLGGIYAIALCDPPAGRLVLARDPFGVKPLYYAERPDGFAFASEPGALIRAGLIEPRLAVPVAGEFLQCQFTTGAATVFDGIKRVLPGETLVVESGRIIGRHRHVVLPGDGPAPIGEAAARARLDALLSASVARHRTFGEGRSAVILSGGIAAATILAIRTRQDAGAVEAFYVEPPSARPVERPPTRALAEALGATPIAIPVGEAEFWRVLPEIAAACDDPVADPAIVATWMIGLAARERGVGQLLSAEGADELFAGYGRFRSAARPWWAGGKAIRRRGHLDGQNVLREPVQPWRDGLDAAELREARPGRSRLQQAQATDWAEWLPNDLLLKLDRAMTRTGISVGLPFLDPAIARFAMTLPDRLKIQSGQGNALLHHWLAVSAPRAAPYVMKRPPQLPVAHWLSLRAGLLGPLVAYAPGIEQLCEPDQVHRLFVQQSGGRAGFAAWSLLFYALWYRVHILRRMPQGDVFDTLSLE